MEIVRMGTREGEERGADLGFGRLRGQFPGEGGLFVPKLRGDGLPFCERLPDLPLLLVQRPLLPFQALPVQILSPQASVPAQHGEMLARSLCSKHS